jgi:hypothetical protein
VLRLLHVVLVLILLPGCMWIDRAVQQLGRMGEPEMPQRDPLYLHLQLAPIADDVVRGLVRETEAPLLDDASTAGRREVLLRLRLDYAAALWNAAAGPNPHANAIGMLAILTVAEKSMTRPPAAEALGPSLPAVLEVIKAAQEDTARLVHTFLGPQEYEALVQVIRAQAAESARVGGPESVDLEELIGAADRAAGRSATPTSLLSVLGMDPFAGLDPATREIAESRQLGERVLFTLQRMPFLIRMNAELLANDLSRELDLDRAITSIERASAAMSEAAQTTSRLPDFFDQQRQRLVADLQRESGRLGTLARDYRGAFEAATTTAATANQALQTFDGVMGRLEPSGAETEPSRPFDVTEYAETAARISEAAASLTGLLERFDATIDAPALARVPTQLTAAIDEANTRGRSLLYVAFALGCALIVVASLAVIATAAILRRHGAALRTRTPAL